MTDLSGIVENVTLKARWLIDLDLSSGLGYGSTDGRTGAWNATQNYFEINTEGWARLYFAQVDLSAYHEVRVEIQTSENGTVEVGGTSNNCDVNTIVTQSCTAWKVYWVTGLSGGGILGFYAHDGVGSLYVRTVRVIV